MDQTASAPVTEPDPQPEPPPLFIPRDQISFGPTHSHFCETCEEVTQHSDKEKRCLVCGRLETACLPEIKKADMDPGPEWD